MTKKALLITGQESETISTLARNLIHAGGMSIFARQMKQMKAIGVDEMHLVTDWFAQDFEKEILGCRDRPEKIFIHNTKNAPLRLLEHNVDGNVWFLIEEGVIIDDRIIEQVDIHPSPTVISLIGHNDFLQERTANGIALQFDEQQGYFGSIAKLSSQTLSANVRKLNSLDGLPNALKSVMRAGDCLILNVTGIPLFLDRESRDVDLVWYPVIRREDGDAATDILLEFSQKAILDWPARFIHRPVENFIIRYLCKLPVSPNMVTLTNAVLGFYVMYLFISGHMLPALFGAYIFGILAGVDGKLARIKISQTKIGSYEYLLTGLVEYGWYFAIAVSLAEVFGLAPYIMATSLVLFQLADNIQKRFFRQITGMPIFAMEPFDRKFRLIAGGRNNHMWALLPFALFDQWFAGLGFICIFAVITFFVHQARLVYHLKNTLKLTVNKPRNQ